jgi:hypothetical protein
MIEIKSWFTNKVIHTIDADTLVGANLTGAIKSPPGRVNRYKRPWVI